MFFALSLVLSALVLPAVCQFTTDEFDGFHPDGPTTGLFAILCILALFYGVLSIWNFVALLIARGHRAPHALLLPTIVLWGWSNATYMALIVLENIPELRFEDELPVLLLPALSFASNLTYDWAALIFFLAILAVLWNREAALHRATATDGKAGRGGHHPVLIAVHAILAALMFIFGTAAPAVTLDAQVKFYNTDIESEFDNFDAELTLDHQLNIANNLYYTFNAFFILTCGDIIATTVVLWLGWKKAGVSDKITNTMLYAVVPLYIILSLLLMSFTIVFSPSGILKSGTLSAIEGADLADSLLINGVIVVIITVILVAGVKKAWWGTGGAAATQQHWPGAQPQYMYATPYGQAPQGGYYPAQPGQMQQQYAADPMQVQQGQYVPQNQYAPQAQAHEQYAPAVQGGYTPHHAEGRAVSYAPSSPAPTTSGMETSVGGYTPSPAPQEPSAHNEKGYREKIGLHE